jgi:hypothetical protein
MKYDKVLQELKGEFHMLMHRYLQKLSNALCEDDGREISHKYIVNRIKRDCVSICSNKLETITFDELKEELIFREVLQDHYDIADIKYMKDRTVGGKRTEFCPDCGEETYLW